MLWIVSLGSSTCYSDARAVVRARSRAAGIFKPAGDQDIAREAPAPKFCDTTSNSDVPSVNDRALIEPLFPEKEPIHEGVRGRPYLPIGRDGAPPALTSASATRLQME